MWLLQKWLHLGSRIELRRLYSLRIQHLLAVSTKHTIDLDSLIILTTNVMKLYF